MVGTHFGKFAHNRASHRLRNPYLVDSGGGRLKRISPGAALHGVPPLDTFDAVEHPSEPTDMDEPAACPPPENNSTRDGLIWRERIARSFRRQIDRISAWQGGSDTAIERTESNPSRPPPNHSNLGEENLFVTHSAPARVVTEVGKLEWRASKQLYKGKVYVHQYTEYMDVFVFDYAMMVPGELFTEMENEFTEKDEYNIKAAVAPIATSLCALSFEQIGGYGLDSHWC